TSTKQSHRQKMTKISSITIKGFKSILSLDQFALNDLNVLIGANGSGKSNFVSYFEMLGELIEQRLQIWVKKQGGSDRLLSFGIKTTKQIESSIRFGSNGYDLILEPTDNGEFVFSQEQLYFDGPYYDITKPRLGSGHSETNIIDEMKHGTSQKIATFCYHAIAGWKVYHFHDTSKTAGVKRYGALHDNEYLRGDASNLAAFLYRMKKENPGAYQQIIKVIQLAIPFFDDFILRPRKLSTGEEQINLLWKQKDSDYPFWPSQLSDGSIRFICIATVLLQPKAPTTIIIDEPELGLHPYAIALIASLIRSAANRMQIIISTQSIPLINEFSINDLIVVERENGASLFKRHNKIDFQEWIKEYSLGELWEKNILGGKPR
ncbi:TPA: AAA family ATPase, partial [Legionella pneumophila]